MSGLKPPTYKTPGVFAPTNAEFPVGTRRVRHCWFLRKLLSGLKPPTYKTPRVFAPTKCRIPRRYSQSQTLLVLRSSHVGAEASDLQMHGPPLNAPAV